MTGATIMVMGLAMTAFPPADQLPALNQSVEAAPVHCSRARDGVAVVKKTPSATTDVALRPRRNRQFEKIAMRALVTAQLLQLRRKAIRINYTLVPCY